MTGDGAAEWNSSPRIVYKSEFPAFAARDESSIAGCVASELSSLAAFSAKEKSSLSNSPPGGVSSKAPGGLGVVGEPC